MAAAPTTSTQFQYLFTPLTIGSCQVRNRILSTAHFTGFGRDGKPSDRHRHYWGSKAKGGIGLIITEVQPVHPSAGRGDGMIKLYEEGCVEAFKPVVEEVHRHGARIFAQIWHPGRNGSSRELGYPTWAPSPIASMLFGEVPHEMTVSEIHEVTEGFAAGAERMKRAGLDGVEIHASHGYLIEQFISPSSNQRSDDYGGSEENRIRFVREVIDAVRDAVGPDYTVGIRISGDEFTPGGLTLEDMQRIIQALTASGKLDYVNVSFYGMTGAVIAPMYVPPGSFVYLAAGIKEVVDVPVFCIGRINDPVMAERILANHQADVVGMTRANICDPELPNKAREGRLDEIRFCIACNEGCWGRVSYNTGISCALNPSVGREEESALTPAPQPKQVMIIGGGIAGMEAARVAAARGHRVSLYERDQVLGGQLQIAAKAPGREDMAEPVRYYERQFEKLGVDVHLNCDVDLDFIQQAAPDAVIVASGGRPGDPPFAGDGGGRVVQARDVLLGRCEVGERVVLVAADQGMEGLSTADFLAERGKQVEVLVPQTSAGTDVEQITLLMAMARLYRKGVTVSTLTQVRAVEDGTVVAFSPLSGQERRIEGVDTVVVAMGSRARDELWRGLQDSGIEVHGAGQCLSPRKLYYCTLDGLRAGRAV
jgi:mycofactocin system FadH/OYE family oxidoreductase 2